MARYIDADLLVENICKIEDLRTLSTKTIGEAISNTPTADVVEIPCRCEKCKYSKIHTCAITGIKTFFCDYGAHPFVVEPTHFCSYGERRTDDDL